MRLFGSALDLRIEFRAIVNNPDPCISGSAKSRPASMRAWRFPVSSHTVIAAAGVPGNGERNSSATTRASVTTGSVIVSDRP